MHATIAVPHTRLADLTNTTFQTGLIGAESAAVGPLGLIPSYIISSWLWEGGLQQPLPNA